MKKKAAEAESAAAPVVKKTRTKAKTKVVVEAPPPPPRKSTAELLREALAAKNSGNLPGGPKLRPQMDGGKVAKDAERRSGKSRKVH